MREYRWGNTDEVILIMEYGWGKTDEGISVREYRWGKSDEGILKKKYWQWNTDEGFGVRSTSPFTAALFEAISLTRLDTSSEGDKPPFSTWGYQLLIFFNENKYILKCWQIHLIEILWSGGTDIERRGHCLIWTNSFCNLDWNVLSFGKIHFCDLDKYNLKFRKLHFIEVFWRGGTNIEPHGSLFVKFRYSD